MAGRPGRRPRRLPQHAATAGACPARAAHLADQDALLLLLVALLGLAGLSAAGAGADLLLEPLGLGGRARRVADRGERRAEPDHGGARLPRCRGGSTLLAREAREAREARCQLMRQLRRVPVQVAHAAAQVRPLAAPRAHGGLLLRARHPERRRAGSAAMAVGECAVQEAAAA